MAAGRSGADGRSGAGSAAVESVCHPVMQLPVAARTRLAATPVEGPCRVQLPLLRGWVRISPACIPANLLRTAGPRCVQAAEQAGYSHLPHLEMQSASSTDEDVEVDHRVHGAAALLSAASPHAAAAAAQPEAALEETGLTKRHGDTSEQQKDGGHMPVVTWPQLLFLSAHVPRCGLTCVLLHQHTVDLNS